MFITEHWNPDKISIRTAAPGCWYSYSCIGSRVIADKFQEGGLSIMQAMCEVAGRVFRLLLSGRIFSW